MNNPTGGLFPKKLQIWALLEVKDLLEGYNIKGVYFLKNIYIPQGNIKGRVYMKEGIIHENAYISFYLFKILTS